MVASPFLGPSVVRASSDDPIVDNPARILSTVIESAASARQAPAWCPTERLTYGAPPRINRYARWPSAGLARRRRLSPDPNRPETWHLARITSVARVRSSIRTSRARRWRTHQYRRPNTSSAGDRHRLRGPRSSGAATIWMHGAGHASFARLDCEIELVGGDALDDDAGRRRSRSRIAPPDLHVGHDRMPRPPASVTGADAMEPLVRRLDDAQRTTGCTTASPCITASEACSPPRSDRRRGAVVIRERFSASQFWSDVARWDCTLFQYIVSCAATWFMRSRSPRARPPPQDVLRNGLKADI